MTTPPPTELVALVEQAYRVLPGERPTDPECCECCIDDDIREQLLAGEPREIPGQWLWQWYEAAVDRPLSKQLWSWLLPRTLDALVNGLGGDLHWEPIYALYRFPTGDRSHWTAQQWDLLERFRISYTRSHHEVCCPGLECMVSMFAHAGWPMEQIFEALLDLGDAELIAAFGPHPQWMTIPTASLGESTNDEARALLAGPVADRIIRIALETEDKVLRQQATEIADALP